MEAINKFGIPSTNTSSEKSNNFSETRESHKGKSVAVESSSTNFAQYVENNKIPPLLSLPPRPTSSSFPISKPPLPPSYPRCRSIALDKAVENELKHGSDKFDPNMDIQKLRRTISNKLAAKRSRTKKTNYILELENTVENLKEKVSSITPQVQSFIESSTSIVLENDSLQQKLDKMSDKLKISEMKTELLKLEIVRLEKLQLAGGNKHLHEPVNDPQLYTCFQDLTGSIVVSPVGLQLVSNSGASEHSNEERQPCLMINQPNEPLTEEINENDEMDIDKYLNLDAIDLDPCNSSS